MTYIVEFSTADPEAADPTWVDITQWVRDGMNTADGRQTELSQIEAGRLELELNNRDHRFTPDNPASPYWPNFRQGKRIRVREVIGYRVFPHFDGFLEVPEGTVRQADVDQTVRVSAVDRLGRMDRTRQLYSTLAEYILRKGGTALKAFWALGETSAPFPDLTGQRSPLQLINDRDAPNGGEPTGHAEYSLGNGKTPLAEDRGGIQLKPAGMAWSNINAWSDKWLLKGRFPASELSAQIHAGDTVTWVAWVQLDPQATWSDGHVVFNSHISDQAGDFGSIVSVTLEKSWYYNLDSNPGKWKATVTRSGGLTGTVVGTDITPQINPIPVGLQLSYSPNTLKLWVGGNEWSTTPTGTEADPMYLGSQILVGDHLSGSIQHMQIYVGNFTRQDFQDQLNFGYRGSWYQSTNDRAVDLIATAGLPAGAGDFDATATTAMARARWAGKSMADVLQGVAATEGGIVFADGSGTLRLHGRQRRYHPSEA